jgi:hypothetical protein
MRSGDHEKPRGVVADFDRARDDCLRIGQPASPSQDEAAVFLVSGETFRIRLSTPELRDAARAVRAGSRARIPLGRILPGADVNTGWSWHLTDVSFHEVTIELCDGRPSDVERAGQSFGNGWFCPWSAQLVEIVALK